MIVVLVPLCAASVASPGPNFALVGRTALAVSGRAAVGAAISAAVGITAGATAYMCLAMFGASAAVARVPWAREAVRVVGGLFLVYLAFRVYSARPSEDEARTPAREGGLRYGLPFGFPTSLSDPQPLVFLLGAFASSDVVRAAPTTWRT